MLRILIVKKVIEAVSCTSSFFGCTEDEGVPDRFYGYPDQDGNLTLLQVYPVIDMEGVEVWGEQQNAEEVEVWSSDEFQEQQMPKNVRWFIDKRSPSPVQAKRVGRLLK